MSSKHSRSEANLNYLYARLDTVRISGHERLRAKARLAQAEAIVDAAIALADFGRRLLKTLVPRPVGRPTKLAS